MDIGITTHPGVKLPTTSGHVPVAVGRMVVATALTLTGPMVVILWGAMMIPQVSGIYIFGFGDKTTRQCFHNIYAR
jgi:hypothetical protein